MASVQKKTSEVKDGDIFADLFKDQDPEFLKELLESSTEEIRKFEQFSEKSNTGAFTCRELGNSHYIQREFGEAIFFYNKSLCYAEAESELLGLAFGNRSAYFFQLKKYDKCLVDIQLAIQHGYPQEKMTKLEARRNDCEKLINEGKLAEKFMPKLCSEPNENIPTLSNAVNIVEDAEHGRRVVAVKDLKVGDIIMIEPVYIGELYIEKYHSCIICLKYDCNLVPCKNCTAAMFCLDCQDDNDIHRFECDIKRKTIVTRSDALNLQIPMMRSIMSAQKLFPNLDEFIEFVENTIASDALKIPDLTDAKSKYETFLTMKRGEMKADSIQVVYAIYHTMLTQKDIASVFNTEQSRRFLMNLVQRHYLIFMENAIFRNCYVFESNVEPVEEIEQTVMFYFGFTKPLFRHSCARNMTILFDNGFAKGVVMRPVKEGEELNFSISYIVQSNYEHRRAYLWNLHKFRCNCELCQLQCNIPDNPVLASEPTFFFFRSIFMNPGIHIDMADELAKKVEAACVLLLEKYGREPMCAELIIVLQAYEKLHIDRINGDYIQ